MVIVGENGKVRIVYEFTGEGEHLAAVQKAIILAIENIGSHKEHSGCKDHQDAVFILSELLRECMLDQSQTNVGLGGRPYGTKLRSDRN